MKVIFEKGKKLLSVLEAGFSCAADIPMLTLKAGSRRRTNIARTIPGNFPYDPAPFPNGKWFIHELRERHDKYRAPWYIATNQGARYLSCRSLISWMNHLPFGNGAGS